MTVELRKLLGRTAAYQLDKIQANTIRSILNQDRVLYKNLKKAKGIRKTLIAFWRFLSHSVHYASKITDRDLRLIRYR